MLLSIWALLIVNTSLGIVGLLLARKRRRLAAVPVLAVLAVTGFMIFQLRDPLALEPQHRLENASWEYIAALYWSVISGLTLPVVGIYLARHKNSSSASNSGRASVSS